MLSVKPGISDAGTRPRFPPLEDRPRTSEERRETGRGGWPALPSGGTLIREASTRFKANALAGLDRRERSGGAGDHEGEARPWPGRNPTTWRPLAEGRGTGRAAKSRGHESLGPKRLQNDASRTCIALRPLVVAKAADGPWAEGARGGGYAIAP
jgi:hypothetical protein